MREVSKNFRSYSMIFLESPDVVRSKGRVWNYEDEDARSFFVTSPGLGFIATTSEKIDGPNTNRRSVARVIWSIVIYYSRLEFHEDTINLTHHHAAGGSKLLELRPTEGSVEGSGCLLGAESRGGEHQELVQEVHTQLYGKPRCNPRTISLSVSQVPARYEVCVQLRPSPLL